MYGVGPLIESVGLGGLHIGYILMDSTVVSLPLFIIFSIRLFDRHRTNRMVES
jgi:hypothetical protein